MTADQLSTYLKRTYYDEAQFSCMLLTMQLLPEDPFPQTDDVFTLFDILTLFSAHKQVGDPGAGAAAGAGGRRRV